MHAAEHRALRELHALAGQLARHWGRLAGRLGGDAGSALRRGAGAAEELQRELHRATADRDLFVGPAAGGVGATLAGTRSAVVDRTLEVNQAMRMATLDVQHVVTLLGYLQRLAATRGDTALEAFHARWLERMSGHERAARTAAVELGSEPERAIQPATPGPVGRAGHAFASGIGAFGEAVDRLAHGRRP